MLLELENISARADAARTSAGLMVQDLRNKLAKAEALKEQLADTKRNIAKENLEHQRLVIMKELFIKSGSASREIAKRHFEKIVTDALQFVTQDTSIKFIIQEGAVRGKPSYEFYVETLIDGAPCLQKPEESCGGGFVDIISITLKYAYNQIFSDPRIMNNTMLLDEPAKMVSEQMSIKVAEYIKFLDKYFGKQTIMITHNETLGSIAQHHYVVKQDGNGISHISVQSQEAAQLNNIFSDVSKLMEGDTGNVG